MGSSYNNCLSLFCSPSLHRSRHYLLFSDNFTAFQGDGPSSLFVGSAAAAAAAAAASVGCPAVALSPATATGTGDVRGEACAARRATRQGGRPHADD